MKRVVLWQQHYPIVYASLTGNTERLRYFSREALEGMAWSGHERMHTSAQASSP